MNREAIDNGLERAILVLVAGAIGLGVAAFGGVRPLEFAGMCWLVLGALALWLVRVWAAPKFRFLLPPVCWAILPFIGYAIWRARTADIEFLARQEVTHAVLCVVLFLIVVNNLYSQDSVRLLCLFLIFLGMAVAMYGIYQWIRHADTVWGQLRPSAYHDRASGTFICPNHLAGYLEMLLPMTVALAVTGRMGAVLRICMTYAALVMFVGIAATQSRGGWIATLAGVAVLVLFMLRTKGQRWMAVGVLIVVTVTGQWLYTRSVRERVVGAEVSGHGREIRLRLWDSGLQMWKENPWWGVGPDHFDARYGKYREAVDRTQGRPGRAHNDYVNTLADYGSVGLGLVLLPLGIAAWGVGRSWRRVQRAGAEFGEKKSSRAAIVLGASAGLIAMLVHSFFDFNMHIPANALAFAALLAILASHIRFATERYWLTARWPVAMVGSAVIAAVLALGFTANLTRTREVILLRQAEALPDGAPEKLALLEKAFALQPKNFETAFALGEQLRGLAWTGGDDTKLRAEQAIVWFQRSLALNKWDVTSRTRMGMCLDWLERHSEAAPYFAAALELDPNYWYTRGMMGWHLFQQERYREAHAWFVKSRTVNWTDNPLAETYLAITEARLAKGEGRPASQ